MSWEIFKVSAQTRTLRRPVDLPLAPPLLQMQEDLLNRMGKKRRATGVGALLVLTEIKGIDTASGKKKCQVGRPKYDQSFHPGTSRLRGSTETPGLASTSVIKEEWVR